MAGAAAGRAAWARPGTGDGPGESPPALPPATPAAAPADVPASSAASVPITATVTAVPVAWAAAGEPLPDQPPPHGALLASETAAWQALSPLWDQPLAGEDPCATAQAQGLQCFRTARMSLHGLRQLDRPGILTLHLPDGPARALVTALADDSATLQAGDQRWRMGLDALAAVWRGEYATLWRTPPGTTARLGNVGSGPAAQWLDQRLQGLQAAGQLPADAGDYATRLRAFQQGQGIDGGGKATPTTFMQVNRLSGVPEPRLISLRRHVLHP